MKLSKSETKVFCCAVYLIGSACMSLFAYMQYGENDVQIHNKYLDTLKLIVFPLILATTSLVLTLFKSHRYGKFVGLSWISFEIFVFIVNVIQLIYKNQEFNLFLFIYYIVRMLMGVIIATFEMNQYKLQIKQFEEEKELLTSQNQVISSKKVFYFSFFQFLAIVFTLFCTDFAFYTTIMSFRDFNAKFLAFYTILGGNVVLGISLIYNKFMGRIIGTIGQLVGLVLMIILYAKDGIDGFLWVYFVAGLASLGLSWIVIYQSKKDKQGLSSGLYYNGYDV